MLREHFLNRSTRYRVVESLANASPNHARSSGNRLLYKGKLVFDLGQLLNHCVF